MIPAWISIYNHYKVWDEITYQFPIFNGAAVEVWNGYVISPYALYCACDYISKLSLKLTRVNKRDTSGDTLP